MTFQQVLETTGLMVRYFTLTNKSKPAKYLVWYGDGQTQGIADDTICYRANEYVVEYYYKKKDEKAEEDIEDVLLSHGYQFEKSEDVYIEDEGVFVIYYYVK